MAESLFSLEVHVESVEQVKISCVIPAISFRLLDYPTLLIYHISPVDVQKLRDKSRVDGSSKEFIETELRDRYGNIPFQKGKSCLFKASVNNLNIQLQSTPLYVMLIDLWHKKPKLVGSTVISLQNAIGKISSDVAKLGLSVPSIFQDQGTFDLFNLMGSVIGRVKISYRFLSLGGSLMSHLPARSVMTQKSQDKNKQKDTKVEANSNEVVGNIADHAKYPYKAVKIPTLIHTEVQTDAPTPKEQTVRYIRIPSVEDSEKGDPAVFITNTVCPPPLFYNIMSHAENAGEKKPQSVKSIEHYHGNMRNPLDDIDYTYYKPDMVQPDGSCGCTSVCVQTDDLQTVMSAPLHEDAVNSRSSGAVDRKEQSEDLPLLTALLEELTYLRTQREGNSRENRTELPKKESAMPTIVKEQRKPRECCEQVMAQKSVLLNHNKKVNKKVASQKKVKFRQTSLTYGMTKTQLLRLEMNQKHKPSNSRLCSSASKDKKPLSEHIGIQPDQGDTVSNQDLGKTHTIFPQPDEKSTSMVCVEVQTDEEPVLIALPDTETEPGTSTQLLGNTVVLEKAMDEDSLDNVWNSSPRSLATSHSSLGVYLPHMEYDSDGSEIFDKTIEKVNPDDAPGILPKTTSEKYGLTGIQSPDLYEPRRKRSLPSRTSTALSMYSDDFEEATIWESQDRSDSGSSNSSSSHSTKYFTDYKIKDHDNVTEIASDQREPVKHSYSPDSIHHDDTSLLSIDEHTKSSNDNQEVHVDSSDLVNDQLYDPLHSTTS